MSVLAVKVGSGVFDFLTSAPGRGFEGIGRKPYTERRYG